MHILLIEDDPRIAALICTYFQRLRHQIEHATDGNTGLEWLLNRAYDVAIIDWMLPLRNGDDIVAIARAAGVKTGLLMLTARADIDDKITGLRRGADDYVTKPFDIGELSARVEAIVRRSGNSTSEQLRGHGIVLDRAARFVLAGNVEVVLTSTEFDLLELLMRHPGVALSRERILHAVWDNPTAVQLTAVDVYISYLRKKIAPHTHTAIETIRGYGYRWQP